MQVAVPNTCQSPRSLLSGALVSVLSQCFADPAFRELILADDALGVDPKKHVDAVPGPFGDLGWLDAAVEPRGEAGVPQVVGPPGEGRGLFRGGERGLAGPDPRAPIGDGGKLGAAYSAEQAAIRHRVKLREVMAQEPR